MSDSENEHSMITRSKKKKIEQETIGNTVIEFEEINENGDLIDLIDTTCNADFDNDMFQKELSRLRGNSTSMLTPLANTNSPMKSKKKKKKFGSNDNLLELLSSCVLMNMIVQSQKPNKRKRKKSNSNMIDILSSPEVIKKIKSSSDISMEINECEEEEELDDEEETFSDEEDIELDEEEVEEDEEDDEEYDEEQYALFSDDEEDLSEEDTSEEEYDDHDTQFIELVESEFDENEEIDYFRNLTTSEKEKHIEVLEEIKEINNSNVPMKFKILNSEMDIKTKSVAIENINKLSEMDVSTGEYCKMDKWINGLIKIPFGKFSELPINDESSEEDIYNYLVSTQTILNKAIYGHKDAKEHILQVLGKWIRNPNSQGNVLALQGPMGNGKTTLVKEGIAKAINRPFAFIALGGASDSSFFDGHSYTYEGSHWGRIIDILIESKCMNPIIYFDELDKVSETHKGEEITHLLTHLTDPSQNSLFQDNYFPGIHINLSKALFIFSFNDESRVDRILKDRMYVINTKGFKTEDKLLICKEYIIPEILETYLFKENDIEFTEEAIRYMIDNYTMKEEGVRNLKRCLETIVSKINIYNLCTNPNGEKVTLTFDIKDFKLPIKITEEIVKTLVAQKEDMGRPPEHMYM